MRKREFTNRMSLRGAYLYATWQSQQNKIIGRDPHVGFSILLRMTILKIGRPLEFFALQKIGVTNFKQGMAFIMWILVSSTSMTGTVKAACVPPPNCAEIGYTATSCDGGFVRCPFDTSKLLCIPCDTKYKYICSGPNIIGGIGSPCNGKYISCECSGGGNFTNGECSQNCTVGMIYYSDKTCSSTYDTSKTVSGIVVKDNELIMSNPTARPWGNYGININGLPDIVSETIAMSDMNGKANTSIIVAEHGSSNFGLTSADSAAIYCNTYSGGMNDTVGKWYLPSVGELYNYLYGNYNSIYPVVINTLAWRLYFDSSYFWSSTEVDYYNAWTVYPYSGGLRSEPKVNDNIVGRSVTCFLTIK